VSSQSRCLPYRRDQAGIGTKEALRIVAVTRRGRTSRALSENDKPKIKVKQVKHEAEHDDVQGKVDVGQVGKGSDGASALQHGW